MPRASAGRWPARHGRIPPGAAQSASARDEPMSAVLPPRASADAPSREPPGPSAVADADASGERPSPLAGTLDALGVMLLHVALDGRVVAWSRAARETLGWEGGLYGERLDPALSADGVGGLARRIAAQGTVAWESAWARADGRRIRVRVAVDLERRADGTRLLCCASPMPEPTPARAELEMLRRRNEAFFTGSPMAACVQSTDLRLVAVNAAYCELMGCDASELVGRDPIFLVAPESVEETLRMRADSGLVARLAAEGGVRSHERRFLRRDGRSLLLRLRTRVLTDPRHGFLLCSLIEDLTDERRRVDDVLRDNEMFRLLFEESPSPKSIQDANFRLLKVNRAYCEMFGYDAADILGRDPIEWTAPEDRDMIVEQRHRASRGERLPATLTRRIRHQDGTLRICRLMRRTTHASDGSRIELITLHDETEEIRMQQRLRAYWQRFERFFEQAPVGLMITDASGRVALVNRMLEDIAGRPRERLIGSSDTLGDAPRDPDARSGTRQRTTLVRDDGSTRWIDRTDRELEDLDGRPMRLTVVHDVTRERHLRDELIETEERFRQFAELVDDAIFVADPGLERVHYANGRFEAIWGTPMAELVREPGVLYAHISPEHHATVAALFRSDAPEPSNEAMIRVEHPRHGARSIRLRVYGRPLAAHGDEPNRADGRAAQRLFAVAEDVTETLRLEQARLDDAIEQRDMLVREVHHRIKNNLQGVAGLLQQSASSRPELGEPLAEVVGRIQAIAQVHGLQVRDGEALVLRRVAAAVFDNLGRTFGIELALHVDDEAAVDRWQLSEQEAVPLALVFNELGTNAIKHRTPGSGVRVRMFGIDDGLVMEIASRGALPEGFDFARLGPSPSGLGLVKALLPRRGARLHLAQHDDVVIAHAELTLPALREGAPPPADPFPRTER